MSEQVAGDDLEASHEPWGRLSARMILADLLRTVLSLTPAGIAILVVGVDPSWGTLWPVVLIAVWGIIGAVADVMRWAVTRYRVTEHEVQRRTGIVTRRYRSVRRDRIRSVDTSARLLHRIAGLRVVSIGAGQQNTAGESAFLLDALAVADATQLQDRLLRSSPVASDGDGPGGDAAPDEDTQVIATLQWRWVPYNMVTLSSYLFAVGLLWGGYWFLTMFGVDPAPWVWNTLNPDGRGWLAATLIALVVVGVIGATGMAAAFVTGYWKFELARTRSAGGSHLRTRRGLLSTREVTRDESRVRGLTISEPLLWRWMAMADTNVVTTGLGLWSSAQPSALVPRGPLSVARLVSAEVLGDPDPLRQPLRPHPSQALRRRLWWATLAGAGALALVAWPVWSGAAPAWLLWCALGVWPLALVGAVIAYRALGHALVGEYLVVRSGLTSRHHTALRRDAVSTIAVRQSVLQRRLGLASVGAMTSAGWFTYQAPDLHAAEAVDFATAAAPGLLGPYRTPAAERA
ncbi:MAG: PH domain-containing protein [Demequina sp.]